MVHATWCKSCCPIQVRGMEEQEHVLYVFYVINRTALYQVLVLPYRKLVALTLVVTWCLDATAELKDL